MRNSVGEAFTGQDAGSDGPNSRLQPTDVLVRCQKFKCVVEARAGLEESARSSVNIVISSERMPRPNFNRFLFARAEVSSTMASIGTRCR